MIELNPGDNVRYTGENPLIDTHCPARVHSLRHDGWLKLLFGDGHLDYWYRPEDWEKVNDYRS